MAKSKYNFNLCRKICDQIADGGSIKKILKSDPKKYPTFQTWCNWKREHVELSDMYYKAIQDKSEGCIENIYQIIEETKSGEIDVKVARVMIDTEKWLASKFYPKMFGTNSSLDITTAGKEITQQVTVYELPANGREDSEKEK